MSISARMNTQPLSARAPSPVVRTAEISTGTPNNPATVPLGSMSAPVTMRPQRLSSAPTNSLVGTGVFRTTSPMPGIPIYEPQGFTIESQIGSMQGQIRQLSISLSEERQQRMLLQAQLSACMRRLDKLDPPETPLRAAVRMVERRGNIRVNHGNGHVQLLRRLDFQPRTTKDEPSAVFRDPDIAEALCKDLAEVSNIFGCPMTIEGHTKGGESEFWQILADRRARIVAECMIDFGANPVQLHTQGLPGRLGKNEVRTEVHMDIRNIKDENAPVQEIDVVVGGRVVERDFVQSGHVVERDMIRPAIVERDISVGGRVVERDFYVQAPTVERDIVGLSGRVVESQRYVRPSSPRTIVRPATMVS